MSETHALTIAGDPRWQHVLERDPAADGTFVYAVATTGVYCRPSCPSRRAKPENITFHASPAAAREAGFRACLRCDPDGPSLEQARTGLVARACRLIEQADETPQLGELAGKLGVSPSHFHRLFRQATGLTPRAWAAANRSRRLRSQLAGPAASVTEAIYDAGFNSNSRFYEQSDSVLGMTPTAYRGGGRGAAIRFAVAECSLGAILVAQSDRGVCAITLGDDPDALVRDLQDRFPKAELLGSDEAFETLVAAVVGFVEAPGIGLDLPLDLRGTAFQERVWQALRQVPSGQTVSYAEVARRIGQPKAVRAVAQACGANSIAVAIPCHRVVRDNGELGGYRWGVERKRSLLEKETRT